MTSAEESWCDENVAAVLDASRPLGFDIDTIIARDTYDRQVDTPAGLQVVQDAIDQWRDKQPLVFRSSCSAAFAAR